MLKVRDLMEFIASLPADPAEMDGGTEHGILDDHTVPDALTRAPLRTLAPDDPVSKAAELMQQG